MRLLLFHSWLTLAPPADDSYEQAIAQLDGVSSTAGDVEFSESIAALDQALDAILAQPTLLANDPDTLARVSEARLLLVWCYLGSGNEAAARDEMDRAIRSTVGGSLIVAGLGPEVNALHDERLKVLSTLGTATITTDCVDRCDLVVEGHASSSPTIPLILGTYDVWIIESSIDSDVRDQHFTVELDQPGKETKLEFIDGMREDRPQTRPTTDRPYIHMALPANTGPLTLRRAIGGRSPCDSPCDTPVLSLGDPFVVESSEYQPSKRFRLPPGSLAYDLNITPVKRGNKVAAGHAILSLGVVTGALLLFMPMIVNTPPGGAIASWSLSGPVMISGIAIGSVLIKRGRTKVKIVPR